MSYVQCRMSNAFDVRHWTFDIRHWRGGATGVDPPTQVRARPQAWATRLCRRGRIPTTEASICVVTAPGLVTPGLGVPPEPPISAMYCLPSMAKVIGGPMPLCSPVGSSKSTFALVRRVGDQAAIRRHLEQQIARGAQRAAEPAVAHRHTPADLLFHRVIGDQRADISALRAAPDRWRVRPASGSFRPC